jgi:hypothetical protein
LTPEYPGDIAGRDALAEIDGSGRGSGREAASICG